MRDHVITSTPSTGRAQWRPALELACARIAPSWPLDRLIAVSPYWGWIDEHIMDAADDLARIAGAPMLMPRAWYRSQRAAGRLTDAHIAWALEDLGAELPLEEVLAALDVEAPPSLRHPLMSDVTDAARPLHGSARAHDVIVAQIGRTCEAYFDQGAAAWPAEEREGLFALWRRLAPLDASARLSLDLHGVEEAIGEFPCDAEALVDEATATLGLTAAALPAYFTALLMSVQGWASVCAHARWEARLAGGDDDTIEQLLAVRLGWELALHRSASRSDATMRWHRARRTWQEEAPRLTAGRRIDWVLQRAVEWNHQDGLARALALAPTPMGWRTGPGALGIIQAQAVFCIDVRSEVIRRHLEQVDPGVRTLGFAGFFGLPIAYADADGRHRPQLPGLLAPRMTVAPDAPTAEPGAPDTAMLARELPSTFAVVESTGASAALELLRATFRPAPASADPARPVDSRHNPMAYALLTFEGTPLDLESRIDVAEQALRGMSLTQGFAPLVALIGHGSAVTNNPQQAALNCGACGGQSGEMNARALATLLNDEAVREGLSRRGVVIPSRTRFVGGLHDTMSDDVRLAPEPAVRASHHEAVERLQEAFLRASLRTRAERAPRLAITQTHPEAVALELRDRASDWAEVRPEWGLARNAAFIVAARDRTRPLHLDGRAFLHEYVWQHDLDHRVLEGILTAPMIVAHWINAQYLGSTVDPSRFGSGDKTLHNVVGGALGVYEGAGGDLRTGLSLQSVHDGRDWVHEPLRLSVFVEAPRAALEAILAKHAMVRQLVEHEWLHLFHIAPDESGVSIRTRDGWKRVAPRARPHERPAVDRPSRVAERALTPGHAPSAPPPARPGASPRAPAVPD